ncbi:triose-phosphate isomerase, partial [Paenibacillus xylanexedens]|uniref:triose-phosphate isomerase n=1 Tax=Paenibacillus xylanexedens TaxID=528191 RepID=UPI0034D9565B
MLKHLGLHYLIIAHSHRRQYFPQTDHTVNKNFHPPFPHRFTPIFSLPHTLQDPQPNQTKHLSKLQTLPP